MPHIVYNKHITACLISGIIGIFCCSSIMAEDGLDDPKKEELSAAETAHVSLIALGSVPQRRYKISKKSKSDESGNIVPQSLNLNSIPVLLPPSAGAVPPSSLYYKISKVSDARSWGRVRVGFNASASVSKVRAGVPLSLNIKEESSGDGYQTYLSLPLLKPGSQSIVFLLASSKGKTPWRKMPRLHILDMNSKSLRGGNILVKNFSTKPVVFSMDDTEPMRLKPGEQKTYKLAYQQGRLHRVSATYLVRRALIFKTALRVPDESLSIFAFYNANPKTNGGKRVGVVRVVLKQLTIEERNKKMPTP